MKFNPRTHNIVAVVVEGEDAGHHFHLPLPELEAAAGGAIGLTKEEARAETLAVVLDILNAGESMSPEEFKALKEDERLRVLAEGLAKLKTAMPEKFDPEPLAKSVNDLQAAVVALSTLIETTTARVAAIEMAILKAGDEHADV